MTYPGLTLTYFTPRSILVAKAFVWEKVTLISFSETVAVYDIKNGKKAVGSFKTAFHVKASGIS